LTYHQALKAGYPYSGLVPTGISGIYRDLIPNPDPGKILEVKIPERDPAKISGIPESGIPLA